jgi:archaellum component FlaC|tara:strand:- start:1620 stop:1865 length:246 start_codon:yes stop_codon:yes gene_type:complete
MVTSDELNRNEKREIFGSYNTNKQIRLKIDALMEAMAKIECNLGIDSTYEERAKAKQEQLIYLSKIKELDPIKYDILKKVI